MDVITIITIIFGYMYLIISLCIAIIKISYTCIKADIIPKLIIYYLIKTINSVIGISYGLLFLNRVEYYFIAPFISVFFVELFTLLIIGALQLHNSLIAVKLKNKIVPWQSNKLTKKSKQYDLPISEYKSYSQYPQYYPQYSPQVPIKKIQSAPQLTDEYMLNYINHNVRPKNNMAPPINSRKVIMPPQKNSKQTHKSKKSHKKKVKKDKKSVGLKNFLEYIQEQVEGVVEEDGELEDIEDAIEEDDGDIEEDLEDDTDHFDIIGSMLSNIE